MPSRAIVCPYCRDALLFENFCRHVHNSHDVKVPLTMTEEEVNTRYRYLGGVIYGELAENGKFKPYL